MYHYYFYQWLLLFFLYGFFGWILESIYVSFLIRKPVNRGFLRGPLLPIYGTGAVMMLWVSLPVQNNLGAIYISGVIAATLLELITGWAMENLFKVRYWDYSEHAFNFHGYICLSSSLIWGFLTILLTQFIHKPIERFLFSLNPLLALVIVLIAAIIFITDFIISFKSAWDLGKLLEVMAKVRGDLEEIQLQLALLKADAKADLAQKIAEIKAERTEYQEERSQRIAELNHRLNALHEKERMLKEQKFGYFKKSLLLSNPHASSRFSEALEELKQRYLKH